MKIRLTVIVTIMVLVCSMGSMSYASSDPFDRFIKPISNPVYFDEATNRTYVNIVHVLQQLPNHINTNAGRLPLDGTLNVTATRINFAVNDRLSIIAAKAGYVDFDPDATLSGGNGWLDVGAGLKYAFILDPDDEFVLSGKVLFEFSNGSRDLFLIKSGKIDIFYGKQFIESQGSGGFFGEENFLFKDQNLFSAITKKQSIIFHISKDEIMNIPIIEWKLRSSRSFRKRNFEALAAPSGYRINYLPT